MTQPTEGFPTRDDPAGQTEVDRPLQALLLAHQRRGWRRGERAPVEDYLARWPEIQADSEAVLDLIYHEIVLREEVGESPRLEEYLGRFPHLAPQLKLQFEVEGALRSDPPSEAGEDSTLISGTDPSRPPGPIGRPDIPGYEVLGELGRGGMGVVYKARQVRLNRIVALKMILAGEHAAPEVAIRFLGEAESVARLHHPHIVQVHASGTHDGRAYFEMEYVPGGSLADRLDGTPLPAREAARLIETLARAIHDVHRLGIVHRDLKPANILLAADGTPKIADFGLAKWLDVETGLTKTDHVLGSPSYMAPEQAGGRAVPIGPAADVYALGAILYELLTGRPPFRAATAFETLEQVKSAEPISPARLQPRLPRDLVTICLKCLRKEPTARYDGADALAEDLRRFGAGEPIRARPVGIAGRAWRWCRREPALAALAAALVAGFLGVATQWRRAEGHLGEVLRQRARLEANFRREVAAHREMQEAHAREQAARRQAEARFQLGVEAVDGYSTLAGEDELLKDPRLEGLRGKLLGTALGFYTEIQRSLEADPTPQARSQLAAAYARVGSIHAEVGSTAEALAAHRRALALREVLADAEPEDPEHRSAVARAHLAIGNLLRASGRLGEAMRSYEQGRAIEEILVRDHPDVALYKADLSWCLNNMGIIEIASGRPDEAVRLQERALALREALARDAPDDAQRQSDLAWGEHDLGLALDTAGRPDEALRRVGRALAAHEELARTHPTHVGYRDRLGYCLADLGLLQRRAGDPEAVRSFERSVAVLEALDRDHPASVRYQIALCRSYLLLAIARAAAGRLDEALANVREAEEIAGRSPPVSPAMLYNLACVYAQCSAGARRGEEGSTPAERAQSEAYADLAMATLRRAIAAGYPKVALRRRDIDLNPLRPRRDFQELMLDLAFPADPFQR